MAQTTGILNVQCYITPESVADCDWWTWWRDPVVVWYCWVGDSADGVSPCWLRGSKQGFVDQKNRPVTTSTVKWCFQGSSWIMRELCCLDLGRVPSTANITSQGPPFFGSTSIGQGLRSKGWVAARCGGKPNDETLWEVWYLHAKAAGTAQRITSFLELRAF